MLNKTKKSLAIGMILLTGFSIGGCSPSQIHDRPEVATVKSAQDVYKVGEELVDGNLKMVVNSVQRGEGILQDEPNEGKVFGVINATIENLSDSELSLSEVRFEFGYQATRANNAEEAKMSFGNHFIRIPENLDTSTPLAPHEVRTGNVVFEGEQVKLEESHSFKVKLFSRDLHFTVDYDVF